LPKKGPGKTATLDRSDSAEDSFTGKGMASEKATSSKGGVINNAYVVEGLTLYDMHRDPRPPVVDESSTTIPVRTLNKDLTCPICMNIIHNTLTVMECLHRFCSGCISKSLRMGKKECPSCRIPCSSRRNLRPDPNFDSFIKVLYPDLDKYEQQEESRVQQINQEYVAKAVAASVEEGMKRQKQAKRLREKTEREYIPPKKEKKKGGAKVGKKGVKDTKSQPTNTSRAAQLPSLPDEISVAVAPHPSEMIVPRLPRPFLRVPSTALLRHISLFLEMKFPTMDLSGLLFGLGKGVHDSVAFAKGDANAAAKGIPELEKMVPLPADTTLVSLFEMWKSPDEILILYYLDPNRK